jgi:hypothetical protein
MNSTQRCTRKQAPRAAIRNPKAVRTCPFGNMCPYLEFTGSCSMTVHADRVPDAEALYFLTRLKRGCIPCKGASEGGCTRANCMFCIVQRLHTDHSVAPKVSATPVVETVAVAPKCQCNQWGCDECNPN